MEVTAMITSYNNLTIHEKINLRSGFDIAVARESGKYNRFAECLSFNKINTNACQKVYNIDRGYYSHRTLKP